MQCACNVRNNNHKQYWYRVFEAIIFTYISKLYASCVYCTKKSRELVRLHLYSHCKSFRDIADLFYAYGTFDSTTIVLYQKIYTKIQ